MATHHVGTVQPAAVVARGPLHRGVGDHLGGGAADGRAHAPHRNPGGDRVLFFAVANVGFRDRHRARD